MVSGWARVAAVGVIVVVTGSTGAPATAEDGSADPEAVSALIEQIAPDQGTVVRGETVDGELALEADGVEISVPVDDPDGTITIEDTATDAAGLSVSLPAEAQAGPGSLTEDGTVVFPAGTGAVAVQPMDDGSVRVQTVLSDASAPTRYTYDLGLPADAVITLDESGGAWFTTAAGDWIGGAAPAWATDSTGGTVATWYEVDGTSLVQVVAPDQRTVFPVVADPYLGVALFSSITTTRRSSAGTTVVVTPSGWGRANGSNATAIPSYAHEFNAKTGNRYATSDIIWQLGCHAQFAPFKSTWNLDTWIHRGSYAAYVLHGCN